VLQLQQTESLEQWLLKLRDIRAIRAKARILARLESARLGNLGDVRSLGDGVSEMRVDVGAGYRVYFTRRQRIVIILLCGGDKASQQRDIARAKRMVKELD
jgi:putative addiction module killer protein